MKLLKTMAYEKKKALAGFLFTLPWVLGFIFFFARPLVKSFMYSVSNIKIETTGVELEFIGFKNYLDAFLVNTVFVQSFTYSLRAMLLEVPVILIFSLFIGYILNQKFFGRIFMRSIFFLPVIIASGVVMRVFAGDVAAGYFGGGSGGATSAMFQMANLNQVLNNLGLNRQLVQFLSDTASSVFNLSWKSGVQILLVITGLQGIPRSLYEATSIEGATGWETFWKITFPLLTPILLVNLIYTIIDNFVDYSNPIIVYIRDQARSLYLANAAAYSWSYFAAISIILAVIFLMVRKKIYKENI